MMSPWLCRPGIGIPDARRRLVCFSYAGGSPSVFRPWRSRLPHDVDLVAVRLPGRESRFSEAPSTDWPQLVSDVAAALRPLLDRPFVLFGHSFGGMLAYEIAREIQLSGDPGPESLIVSGCRAGRVTPGVIAPYDAPGDVLWQWVSDVEGTPSAVLADPEFRRLVEPVLRSDLQLAQTWNGATDVLDTPIVTLAGSDDPIATRAEIARWRDFTAQPYRHVDFAGGHFFIHRSEPEVVATVASVCHAPRKAIA